MAGNTNYPTALDDNSSLLDVTDGVTEILDEHHNNTKEAVIALERKLGIYNTSVPTAIDTRLGHPTLGHDHSGASGLGKQILATAVTRGTGIASVLGSQMMFVPSAAVMRATGIASVVSQSGATILIFVPTQIPRHIAQIIQVGSLSVASKISAPVILGRTLQLESVQAGLRVGPSGATTALIVRFGASHIYGASVGLGIRFAPGATAYRSAATPNVVTYPSGAVISLDGEAVGSNDPGQDAGITLFFRE